MPDVPALTPPTVWHAVVDSGTGYRLHSVAMRDDGLGLAAGGPDGLWKSTDGGASWTPTMSPGAQPTALALRDDGAGILTTRGRLFWTNDAATTWTESSFQKVWCLLWVARGASFEAPTQGLIGDSHLNSLTLTS
jgi:photosystem II stability/assembly factor-like uncharacterized protein